jgi:hypothetical protein
VAARVVGQLAQECDGILADPQDPAGSILYRKLESTPPCGARMPFGSGNELSDAEIACVKSWIGEQVPQGTSSGAGGTGGTGGMGGSGGIGGAAGK